MVAFAHSLTHFARNNIEFLAIADELRRWYNFRYPFPLKRKRWRLIIEYGCLCCLKIGIFPKYIFTFTFRFDAIVFRCHDFCNVQCLKVHQHTLGIFSSLLLLLFRICCKLKADVAVGFRRNISVRRRRRKK